MATNLFSPAGDRGVEIWCREPEDGQLLALAKSGLFGRGNSARDGHLGWRRQASAVSRQEGPAQSSEPEKHRR
jgi:hypothetical protein